MEEKNKIYLKKTEYDEFYDFLSKVNREDNLSFSDDAIVFIDTTSKRSYLAYIEVSAKWNVWYWFSNEYSLNGPYFIYKDTLDNITNKLSWY